MKLLGDQLALFAYPGLQGDGGPIGQRAWVGAARGDAVEMRRWDNRGSPVLRAVGRLLGAKGCAAVIPEAHVFDHILRLSRCIAARGVLISARAGRYCLPSVGDGCLCGGVVVALGGGDGAVAPDHCGIRLQQSLRNAQPGFTVLQRDLAVLQIAGHLFLQGGAADGRQTDDHDDEQQNQRDDERHATLALHGACFK